MLEHLDNTSGMIYCLNVCFWKQSRGESVDMDGTQMNSGIKWQQHSLSSSGSHVSWRASKETRESLSAQWLWTVSTNYCSGLVICSHYKYYFCIFLPLCIFSTPYQPNGKTNKQQASGRGNRPLWQRKHLMVWLLTWHLAKSDSDYDSKWVCSVNLHSIYLLVVWCHFESPTKKTSKYKHPYIMRDRVCICYPTWWADYILWLFLSF